MKRHLFAAIAASISMSMLTGAYAEQGPKMMLLPKFLGILPFDQTHKGAEEAAKELGGEIKYVGPTAENSVAGQIEFVSNAKTQGVNAIMIANNAGDQIAPSAKAAKDAGIKVVTWDSPIPSAVGEDLFVADVDFGKIGVVLADMALHTLGPEGGEFAIIGGSPNAPNQRAWIASMKEAIKQPKYSKLKLMDVVYGNDTSETSYNQAQALLDKYPNLKLIEAPNNIGLAAAAKALQDEGVCGKVKVSGLGIPAEMVAYTKSGCAPEFAFWSFTDLGYLTYYTTYLLATGKIKAVEGQTFKAGRMGQYTITKDPDRKAGLRIVMGPFTIYNKTNVEAAARQ
jgi:rhamnose transport system substrate-binding protein